MTEVAPLNERLIRACVAGCTCDVKASDINCHDPMCHYRLFTEAEAKLGWQPMETAPRNGRLIDVWLQSESPNEIEFYCSSRPRKMGENLWGGRATGWLWTNDKFRPYVPGLNLPVLIQPCLWISPPDDPYDY